MAPTLSVQLGLFSEKAQRQIKHPGPTQTHSQDAVGEQRGSRPARSTPAPWLHQWSSPHFTHAALAACTAGKEDFSLSSPSAAMPIPHYLLPPAPEKLPQNKAHCFVLPVPLLTRKKHGQGLARTVLSHSPSPRASLYTYVVLSFLSHWQCKRKEPISRGDFLFWACRDTSLVKGK